MVKRLRAASGLSQPKFAALLRVDVGTLRNWEQGIREPITVAALAAPTVIAIDRIEIAILLFDMWSPLVRAWAEYR